MGKNQQTKLLCTKVVQIVPGARKKNTHTGNSHEPIELKVFQDSISSCCSRNNFNLFCYCIHCWMKMDPNHGNKNATISIWWHREMWMSEKKKGENNLYMCTMWEKAKWHITYTSNFNPFFKMDTVYIALSLCLVPCSNFIAVITTSLAPGNLKLWQKFIFSENNYIKQHECKNKLQCGLHVTLLSFQRFKSAT